MEAEVRAVGVVAEVEEVVCAAGEVQLVAMDE